MSQPAPNDAVRIRFSPGFDAEVEEHGYAVYYFPDRDEVAVGTEPGGEYQLRVTRRDGDLEVRPVERGQRGDVLLRADEIGDVERFITTRVKAARYR
ncbi:hypothetical protein AAIB33_13100 [Microbacterium sp. AZCO]|uniref:hypothetical protein n=1 Tax=Microbacterium sp. AZCO TaxID=3142976 RepID=UPI0031F45C15